MLTNLLGGKYAIALALVDRETRQVSYGCTDDLTPEVASTLFLMEPAQDEKVFLDRLM